MLSIIAWASLVSVSPAEPETRASESVRINGEKSQQSRMLINRTEIEIDVENPRILKDKYEVAVHHVNAFGRVHASRKIN